MLRRSSIPTWAVVFRLWALPSHVAFLLFATGHAALGPVKRNTASPAVEGAENVVSDHLNFNSLNWVTRRSVRTSSAGE